MSHYIVIRLLIAIIGLLLLAACHRSPARLVTAPQIATRKFSESEFHATGSMDMFMEDYLRPSDGAVVRFSCEERVSEADALSLVRTKRTARLVERTDVVDADGTKIGERVVWLSPDGSETTWNERARLFSFDAPSLSIGRTFEKSKVWGPAGCSDFRSSR